MIFNIRRYSRMGRLLTCLRLNALNFGEGIVSSKGVVIKLKQFLI